MMTPDASTAKVASTGCRLRGNIVDTEVKGICRRRASTRNDFARKLDEPMGYVLSKISIKPA